jgi:hypothetical protein
MKIIFSLIIGAALVVSGFGQTRNVLVGTNSAVVQPTNFWSADASNARAGLGLGSAATNPATAFQPSSSSLSNFSSGNFTIAISNGGTGSTNAETARTNLGLGWSALTNTNAATSLLGFTTNGQIVANTGTNVLTFTNMVNLNSGIAENGVLIWDSINNEFYAGATFHGEIAFGGTNANSFAATTRTNLGLGLPALTNTNTAGFNTSLYGSGTNPVLYNTNGEVVSPTNFWQVAPLVTTFIESQPTTNQTTNIAAGRNLHIHSIAFSTVGITNTIALPTTNSFNGDIALVVHQGPTSSVTAVRTAGAGTNLITLNQFEQTVEFVYYNNVWQFNHNLSFIEPIFFSGTNAEANRGASRTNLGLGSTNMVEFAQVVASDNDLTIALGVSGGVLFEADGTNYSSLFTFLGDESANLQARARTNLGLPLTALTNTNNSNFRSAIELGEPNNVTFSNVTASGTLTATSTVTAKTNLVVEGFVDYTASRTNNTPTNTPNFAAHFAWIEVKIGTNSVFIPVYK